MVDNRQENGSAAFAPLEQRPKITPHQWSSCTHGPSPLEWVESSLEHSRRVELVDSRLGGRMSVLPTLRRVDGAIRFGSVLTAALGFAAVVGLDAASAVACGFHNSALSAGSVNAWVAYVKQAIPPTLSRPRRSGPVEQPGSSQLRMGRGLDSLKSPAGPGGTSPSAAGPLSGGSIDSRLTPQEHAALSRMANDCLQIMAYLALNNMTPSEFPTFDRAHIPTYRRASKSLLASMGPTGTQSVAGQIRAELMSAGRHGMPTHSQYHSDLVQVLAAGIAAGDLSAQEIGQLMQAALGAKPEPQATLAKNVMLAIAMSDVELDIAVLVELIRTTDDPVAKKKLSEMVAKRVPSIATGMLLDISNEFTSFGPHVENELKKRFPKADIPELLEILEKTKHQGIKRAVQAHLAGRQPTYAEAKGHLTDLLRLADAGDSDVATAAREQLKNAFLRAPISHCLYYIGQVDAPLDKLIWTQVDFRIARADAARKADYFENGLAVLGHKDFNLAAREAAIEFLGKLKAPETVDGVADLLLKLPRELWPKSGQLLHSLTGQDFGPHDGDAISGVLKAQKLWQAWDRENKGN